MISQAVGGIATRSTDLEVSDGKRLSRAAGSDRETWDACPGYRRKRAPIEWLFRLRHAIVWLQKHGYRSLRQSRFLFTRVGISSTEFELSDSL